MKLEDFIDEVKNRIDKELDLTLGNDYDDGLVKAINIMEEVYNEEMSKEYLG